ncbi:MAG: hypothetical protein Q8K96_13835 [Rubrivivax sp.]|nr:hypothetical protein [Rubrivivax sp.]
MHRRLQDQGLSGTRWTKVIAIGLLALPYAQCSWAQREAGVRIAESAQTAWYRMTSADGYARLIYWRDSNENASALSEADPTAVLRSRQAVSDLRGEVFLMTHGYVYHPNLLLLDLGAGLIFDRNSLASDGMASVSRGTLYNLNARAQFLRGKPYRGGLFFERTNDSQAVGPAQSLLTENTSYGFDFSLLAPVTPLPLRVDARRFHSQGQGAEQVIDDRIDEINFRAERAWRGLGETRLHYQAIESDSRSGSLGLPIRATRSHTERADLDTNLVFGARKEYELTQGISLNTLSYTANEDIAVDHRQFRFNLQLRGRPSAALQTHARYQFDENDQRAASSPQTSRLSAVNAGLSYQPSPQLGATLEARTALERSSVLSSTQSGFNGSLLYRHALPLGELTAGYGGNFFWRDQNAAEPVAQVVGERVTLAGTSTVTLRQLQVIANSVVVSNAPRTQIFLEGKDYVLSQVGLNTRIQRLIAGNILDGQDVVIDYDFDTGGTYTRTQLDHTVEFGWNLKSLASVYVRFLDSAPNIVSGTPNAPLNTIRSTTYGARGDFPLTLGSEELQLGGNMEREDRRETLAPFQRSTVEIFGETTLPRVTRGGLRLGARHQTVEYTSLPEQDVNQKSYSLKLWSRIATGVDMSLEATRTSDTGTPQATRQSTSALAKARWRVRRFLMTFEWSRNHEVQGPTERTHTRARLELRRNLW